MQFHHLLIGLIKGFPSSHTIQLLKVERQMNLKGLERKQSLPNLGIIPEFTCTDRVKHVNISACISDIPAVN
jgi:hypothetical protein